MTMESASGAEETCGRANSARTSKAATAPRASSTDGSYRFNWFLSLRRKRSSPTNGAVTTTQRGKKNDGAIVDKDELFTSDESNHSNQHEGGSVFYTLRKRFQKKFTSVKVKAYEPNVAETFGASASTNATSSNSNINDGAQCNGTMRDAGLCISRNDFARIVIERHTQNPIRFSSPNNASLPVIINGGDAEPNPTEDNRSEMIVAASPIAPTEESTADMDDMMVQMRIDLLQYGWYWGKLTRLAAQKRLAQQVNGTFLVRDSQTEKHQFTVSFRSSGITLHCRIDFENSYWSFSGLTTPTTYKTMVDLIQDTMKKSEYGVIGYVKQDTTLMPPFSVRLTRPINRFYEVSSLQHLCRFLIRQQIDAESIAQLPLPEKLKDYLKENFYDL